MELRYDVVFYLPRIGPALAASSGAHPGGAETQVVAIARGLVARGWKIAVVAFDTPEGMPMQVDGIDVVLRPPYGPRFQKAREPIDAARSLGSVKARCIVQRCASFETAVAASVARATRTPFVYSSASDADFHMQELPFKWWERHLYRMGVRGAAAIVVQTERQVALCREVFRREPVLVKSLAELGPANDGIGQDVLWVSRLSRYKHPESFVALARALPEIPFTMVGISDPAWPQGDAILREARDLPNVTVMGGLRRAEAVERIGRAAVVVSTSTAEGMPNIFLEAWGRGVPVISQHADPVGGLEERGLGYCCNGSLENTIARVRELWAARERNDGSATRQAYVRAEHAPEVILDGWTQLLTRVIKPPSRPRSAGHSRKT